MAKTMLVNVNFGPALDCTTVGFAKGGGAFAMIALIEWIVNAATVTALD